jgi:tripartite ATP-independent transporter DctM subunit
MFMAWAVFDAWRRGFRFDDLGQRFTFADRIRVLPRVLPFILIIVGVMYTLYGGVATPSEAAGAGALLTLVVVFVVYRLFRSGAAMDIFSSTMRESVMIMMILASAELFAFALSSLFITQTLASAIADLDVNRWVLMGIINVFLLVAGMFLPPVAVIVMATPLLLPIVTQAGFDPYWFAVILTINMEIGLITPPIGLNLFVINAIAPNVPTSDILWGALPYCIVMMVAIVILCFFPGIATWFPDYVMGPAI